MRASSRWCAKRPSNTCGCTSASRRARRTARKFIEPRQAGDRLLKYKACAVSPFLRAMSIRLFLRSLRHRHDWRGAAPKRIASGLKYLLRCARMARRQSAWLQFVYGSPRLSAILAQDPRLLERWHHHYINRRFGRARRIEIVADHFRFAFVQLPEDMADGVYLHGGYRIGALTLKDNSELRIELRRPTGRSREGELALCLTNSHDQVLSSAVFTVADEGSSLLIGCMQGASAELGREAGRELTRQCHGLRPKNLLFSLD